MFHEDSRFPNSFSSATYCPILKKHASMESLFIQLSDDVEISIKKQNDPYDWFCGAG